MQIKKITDLISNTTEQSLPSCVKSEILSLFENFNPEKYAKTRNYLDGHISRLSIAIKHGIVTNQEIFNLNKQKYSYIESEKFIQELAWRDFWRSYAYQNPDYLWKDVEEYKTGFKSHDYRDELPNDILTGQTPTAIINHFIRELIETGFIHNHARMYLASYIVHFRKIKWQAGAKFFLEHLLDGDLASNNFSWQWIASTFAGKPYIFNLDNVIKYCGKKIAINPSDNLEIDGSYEDISERLFPKL